MLTAVCAIGLLLPVWVPAFLATTDGPSHLYNAVVGVDLREGGQTYGGWLEQDASLAPNRAANTALSLLAPAVGPSMAEKLLFSFTLLGTFLLTLSLASRGTGLSAPAVLICAWLAQHWFAWTGFFDFSLSVLVFCGLLLVLRQPAGHRRSLLIQVAVLFLAWTHLFTMAIGVALTGWIALLGAIRARRPADLLPAVPPAFLLVVLLAGGGTGGGGVGWGHKGKALAGLVVGDFLATFHPIDLLAGVIVMIGFWAVLLPSLRAVRDRPIDTALPVFAAGLVLLSVIGPDAIGEGSYISARLRFLAVLTLVPLFAVRLGRLRPRMRGAAAVILAAALLTHTVFAVQRARLVSRDAIAIDTLLGAADARPGDGIQTSLADHERGAFRISAYAHLPARAATRRRLVVLDNYEARLGVFPTRWRVEPEALRIERRGDVLRLQRRTGAPWSRPIHLVHDAPIRVTAADSAIVVRRTVAGIDFAVTTVTLGAGQ